MKAEINKSWVRFCCFPWELGHNSWYPDWMKELETPDLEVLSQLYITELSHYFGLTHPNVFSPPPLLVDYIHTRYTQPEKFDALSEQVLFQRSSYEMKSIESDWAFSFSKGLPSGLLLQACPEPQTALNHLTAYWLQTRFPVFWSHTRLLLPKAAAESPLPSTLSFCDKKINLFFLSLIKKVSTCYEYNR
ncbi:hypothetical protein CSB62_23750 [Vibrio splendidus]|uniref:Uncharacterized protein n=2 Tax=Vibrio lentus TaxID=136468 RepID=A0A855IU37_9VIBR|nr:hypothetical protein [Vibrio lentus]PHN83510.1 hypothetical protein CSB62_23750 [Vibrio splendidus]MCB5362003.1 hypothetical protein [Vibrio lentus]MCB5452338.1 hypothetical protein [Vibrio lentus]MCB5464371.1 hypothetical protein [Vibrio lentus]MCC4794859.1 hypothetical protein [Vibrio lentus]